MTVSWTYFNSKSSASCPLLSWTSVLNCFSMLITWFLSGLVNSDQSQHNSPRPQLTHRRHSCSVCWHSGEWPPAAPISWSGTITINSHYRTEIYTQHLLSGFLEPGLLQSEIFIIDPGGDRGGFYAGAEVNLCRPLSLHEESVVRVGLLVLGDGDSDSLLTAQPFLFKRKINFKV